MAIIAGYIVMGVSIIFLLIGVLLFVVGRITWKCTEETTGKIVGMCLNAFSFNQGGTGDAQIGISLGAGGAGNRCPVFTYQVNGMEYHRASNVSWNRQQIKRKMNQPRAVYYDPANPSVASLSKQSVFSIIGKIFLLIGGVVLAIGLVLLCL